MSLGSHPAATSDHAFYIRRKGVLTNWPSLRSCAAGGLPTEELCACCFTLGVCFCEYDPGHRHGHRHGLSQLLGDPAPAKLQRVTQLICSGDKGIDVVLSDVKQLVTQHRSSSRPKLSA